MLQLSRVILAKAVVARMKRLRIACLVLSLTPIVFGGCTRRESTGNTDRMSPDMYAAESMFSAIAVKYYRDGILPSMMAEVEDIAEGFDGPYGKHADLIDPKTRFIYGDDLDFCSKDFQWTLDGKIEGVSSVHVVRRGTDWYTVLVPSGEKFVPYDDVINVSCAIAGEIYETQKGKGDAVVDLLKMREIDRRYSRLESYAKIEPTVIVRKDRIIMHITSEAGRETLIFSELGPGRDRLKRQRDDP